MVLKWTPIFKVPIHRYFEVLSVGFVIFCEIICGPVCAFLTLCLLVKSIVQIKFAWNIRSKADFYGLLFFLVVWKCLLESRLFILFGIYFL